MAERICAHCGQPVTNPVDLGVRVYCHDHDESESPTCFEVAWEAAWNALNARLLAGVAGEEQP